MLMTKRAKSIYERYGYFQQYIQVLGKLPFNTTFSLEGLGLSRGAVQMAYKEMRELQFGGSIDEYLAWVGGMFMLELWSESGGKAGRQQLLFQLEGRPIDAAVLLRASSIIRAVDLDRLNCDKAILLETLSELFRVRMLIDTVEREWLGSDPRPAKEELKKIGYSGLMEKILAIHSLMIDSGTSSKAHSNKSIKEKTIKTISPLRTKEKQGSGAKRSRVQEVAVPQTSEKSTRLT